MARILLHTCCGPCTVYPLQVLRWQSWEVFGFFYNTNIHPYQEYERRLQALKQLSDQEGLRVIVRDDYDIEGFLRQVVFREQQRCIYCYSHRLEATARLAKKSGFDAFSTTLLYSKFQKHELIKTIANDLSQRHSIPFYYEDFRPGWKAGQDGAKSMGLYRQQYCGCIYSENERFNGKARTSRGKTSSAQE